MLSSTFVHIPGIGDQTERKLWEQGIGNWSAFLENAKNLALSDKRRQSWTDHIRQSIDHLHRKDATYFAHTLPAREHWRCYPDFSQILFLDIETTSSYDGNQITMVGTYDGTTYRPYIDDWRAEHFGCKTIDELENDLVAYDVVVTFFGSGFDLPILQRSFHNLQLPPIHIDLCHLLRRLGYRGGLKAIERKLDLMRSPETRTLTSADAPLLWTHYQRGNQEALRVLLRYNEEDVVNLAPLLKFACGTMQRQLKNGKEKC